MGETDVEDPPVSKLKQKIHAVTAFSVIIKLVFHTLQLLNIVVLMFPNQITGIRNPLLGINTVD